MQLLHGTVNRSAAGGGVAVETPRAYEEIIDFLAAGSTPESVLEFQPSQAVKARVLDLLARHKSDSLTPDETSKLDHYLQLAHIMRMVKARARQRLSDRDAHLK